MTLNNYLIDVPAKFIEKNKKFALPLIWFLLVAVIGLSTSTGVVVNKLNNIQNPQNPDKQTS